MKRALRVSSAHEPARPQSLVAVQDISLHNAPDLHVRHARKHSAQPFLVRDYLD